VVVIINPLLNIRWVSHIAAFHKVLERLPKICDICKFIRLQWLSKTVSISFPIFVKMGTGYFLTIGITMRRTVQVQTH